MTVPNDPINIRAEGIEARIFELTNRSRQSFTVAVHNVLRPEQQQTLSALLREWIIASGGSERKVIAASDYVLCNAYRAGKPYIDKMNSEDIQKRFKGGGRNNRGLDLEFDMNVPPVAPKPGFGPEIHEKLGGLIGTPEAPELEDMIFEDAPAPEPTPLDDPLPENGVLTTTLQELTRAADSVITRRLAEARNDLEKKSREQITQEVDRKVRSEVATQIARLDLPTQFRDEVVEIANQTAIRAAQDFVDQMVPKRIQIIRKDRIVDLPAEPRHESFEEILFWLELGKHVYIVGPRGTGKTHLGKQLAEALGRRYIPIGQTLTKYELSGHLGPTGEYVGTLFRDAIENGGFCMADEIDTWAAAATVFTNTPLANKYCPFPDRVVPVHPDFIFCAAANTYGHGATMQYQGRNPLDAASLDRFAFVEMRYDETLEKQLYGNGPWVQYCHRVRAAAEQLRIHEAVPSMRGIDLCVDAAGAGGKTEFIEKSVLWKGLPADSISKIKAIAGEPPRMVGDIREVA